MSRDTRIFRYRYRVRDGRIEAGDFGIAMAGGRVTELGAFEEIRARFADVPVRDALAVARPPANPHTHLDLSAYPLLAGSFPGFVDRMAAAAKSQRGLRSAAAARRGEAMLAAKGALVIGDIVGRPGVMESHLESSLTGIAYWEVLAPAPTGWDKHVKGLRQAMTRWRKAAHSQLRIGLSPHSPYMVHRQALREIADWSIQENLPLQIHLAESPAEAEFFQTGSGPLAQALRRFGATPDALGFRPDPSLTPVMYLAETGVLEAKPVLVHAVNVTDEDIRIIAASGCAVVVCPRSNANLLCGAFPWKRYLKAGVKLAIGTDSVASAGGLDPFAEVQTALGGARPEAAEALSLVELLEPLLCHGYHVLGATPPEVAIGDADRQVAIIGARRKAG